MSIERHARAKELFLAACKLASHERRALLDQECGEDAELRDEVESLLRFGDETATPPEIGRAHTGSPSESGEKSPGIIEPYRLLQKIGEGGMGEVWEAEQERPVRRRVALKLIKAGMDTKEVVARFESERQALAMMSHPSIAKVFEAGATEQGRPFFAMEYVKGEPITEYCDKHRLSTAERLKLLVQVCEGVQHAHQKGIIHRDLKPSNVLVEISDGRPVPKIIDFGVAKATQQRLTEKTMFTQLGVMVGTPAYMSPEQAEMTGLDVDTRTDVYSAGVMLYELLVGALPFDPQELQAAGYDEMRRRIREEEPSKPSTRITTPGEESVEAARRRNVDLSTLKRELQGDLDWITMKAMAKDRTRRYGSPNELAADIGRHLRHEPVEAGPPNAVYVMRKFVRRHRVGVGVAVMGGLLLATLAASMTVQAARIAHERDRANREATVAKQTSEFLEKVFEVSDPEKARGSTVTARELLDRGAEQVRRSSFDNPEVRARLMGLMGRLYNRLGLYERAEAMLLEPLDLQRSLLGEEHTDTLSSMYDLAALYDNQGRYREAELLLLELLEKQRRVLGDEHRETLITMNLLAVVYSHQGRHDEAESLYSEILAIRMRVLGDDHPLTLKSMNNMALSHKHQNRHAEAEKLFLDCLKVRRRVLGDDHPDTLSSINNLATLYDDQGRHAAAEPLLLEALKLRKHVFGDSHPETLASSWDLATLYQHQGRYDEAEKLYFDTLETLNAVLGQDHPDTLSTKQDLAALYERQGRLDEAESVCLETLEARKRVLGADHPDTLWSMNNLANIYLNQGRYDEAESMCLETIEKRKRVLGVDHQDTRTSVANLGSMYVKLGRYDEAEPILLDTYRAWRDLLTEEDPRMHFVMHALAFLYVHQGRFDEAEPLLLELVETRKRVLGEEHPDTLRSMNLLTHVYVSQGDLDKAEPLYLIMLEAQERTLGKDHPETLRSLNDLAFLYQSRGRFDEAEPLILEALDNRRRVLGGDHPDTIISMNNLAFLYQNLERHDELATLRLEILETCERALGPGHPHTVLSINELAWFLLTRDPIDRRDPDKALELSLEANKRTNFERPEYLDTLSLAYYLTGDIASAVQNQNRAVSLLPEGESPLRSSFEEALEKYEAALEDME